MVEKPDKDTQVVKRDESELEEEEGESFSSVLKAITSLINTPAIGQYFNHTENQRKTTFRFFISLFLVVTAIIVIMSFLTYYGKVSGDALLFLTGTVVGYILGIFQDIVKRGNIL